MFYDKDLSDVPEDPPVVLLVALLALVEVHFTRKELQHHRGPMLELVEQGRCIDIFWILGRLVIRMLFDLWYRK